MRYVLLASGSKGNSCLIETQNTRVLLDCGSTKRYLKACFQELNLTFDQLDGLVITHDHSDHISQIKHFSSHLIYSPVSLTGIESRLVSSYESFIIGDLTFFPFELSHDVEKVMGYVISDGIEKMVYVTDTGYIKESDLLYCHDAHYIVMESNYDPQLLMNCARPYQTKMRIMSDTGHLSNDLCGFYLSQIVTPATREIVLAHLSQQANHPEVALETVMNHLVKVNYQASLVAASQFEMVQGGCCD